MNLLHTSDWHIGRALCGRKRYDEYAAFLGWLAQTIDRRRIEVLLIVGDVFDSSTPSNRAQQLYYQFLKEISAGCCRHVVIVGGNHDSPSLLEAPRDLLRLFQVHVVGCATENPEDEVLILKDPDGRAELVVCAVPYLRDRDIRNARPGESVEEKNINLVNGIADHYRQVMEIAEQQRRVSAHYLPIVATGHLFVAGASSVEGDGMRDLYVGSLVHVAANLLPDTIDYLALGHLHRAQTVGGNPRRRYCGAPLPMSFNEADSEKCVLAVALDEDHCAVSPIAVPCFRQLRTLRGSLEELLAALEDLRKQNEPVWLEVIYDGDDLVPQLQLTLHEAIADSPLEILRIVNNRLIARVLEQQAPRESLDDLSEEAVFHRCLDLHGLPEAQGEELLHLFRETLQALADEDRQAE